MKRYICIHAHCYQPPRENPWLESIEQQDSAYPYHDWNERVNAECYAQNVAARILDVDGMIIRIVNNFSRISFNMGPTLLSWMEEHAPETYRAILDADRVSQERFGGHGAALAQVYNHMIMPLANRRDRRTQVIWGIRDFERRFGRKPEGMWLAETAVDLDTLELLAEHEIQFTILSPYQARRVRPLCDDHGGTRGTGGGLLGPAADEAAAAADWIDVEGSHVDPTRPYVQKLPSGRRIVLFFYDGPIARGVAFERLLDSGESLARRLKSGFSDERDWPQLMHIATDGESYGHHHRHGEMALAYALDMIERNEDVELTVYGAYLASHPPAHEVEIIENTAWSCPHGLGRWQDNCGCSTGARPGWRQNWRRPLRDALDWLRDRLIPRYEERGSQLLADPWRARDEYIDVILDRGRDNMEAFLRRHQRRELSPDEQRTALMLLELQRHAMLMYTSCGWFFDELSGIETVQVMQYAGRAVQLARMLFDNGLEDELMDHLARAPSNLPEWRDGRRIYERAVKPAMVSLARVAAHYAVSSLFEDHPTHTRIHCYDVERLDQEAGTSDVIRLLIGQARVTSLITWQSSVISYAVAHLGGIHVLGGVSEHPAAEAWSRIRATLLDALSRSDLPRLVRVFDQHFPEQFALPSLFRDQQRAVINRILAATLERADAALLDIYRENATLIRFLAQSGMPVPRTLQTAASHALTQRLQQTFERPDIERSQVEELLAEAQDRKVTLDKTTLQYALENRVEHLARQLAASPLDIERLLALKAWVDMLALVPFEVDLWQVQNIYYQLIGSVLAEQRRRVEDRDPEAVTWYEHFVALGESLRVRVNSHALAA